MTTANDILGKLEVKCLWRVAVEKTDKPQDYPMKCQLCRGYGKYDGKVCGTYETIKLFEEHSEVLEHDNA